MTDVYTFQLSAIHSPLCSQQETSTAWTIVISSFGTNSDTWKLRHGRNRNSRHQEKDLGWFNTEFLPSNCVD